MFACSMYPGDQELFRIQLKKEITYQVKRLKHHPSIALWCGNNEIGLAWYNWGWKEKLPSGVWEKDYHMNFFINLSQQLLIKMILLSFIGLLHRGLQLDYPMKGKTITVGR